MTTSLHFPNTIDTRKGAFNAHALRKHVVHGKGQFAIIRREKNIGHLIYSSSLLTALDHHFQPLSILKKRNFPYKGTRGRE